MKPFFSSVPGPLITCRASALTHSLKEGPGGSLQSRCEALTAPCPDTVQCSILPRSVPIAITSGGCSGTVRLCGAAAQQCWGKGIPWGLHGQEQSPAQLGGCHSGRGHQKGASGITVSSCSQQTLAFCAAWPCKLRSDPCVGSSLRFLGFILSVLVIYLS